MELHLFLFMGEEKGAEKEKQRDIRDDVEKRRPFARRI